MGYDFNGQSPIYLQITEYIKTKIINKQYLSGQKIPSVRELSIELGANPNTIQKALFELENIKLIETERTNGKFVTTDESLIEKIRLETINEKVSEFLDLMSNYSVDKDKIINLLKNYDKEEDL